MITKNTWNIAHFSAQNTPLNVEAIGNICLVIATAIGSFTVIVNQIPLHLSPHTIATITTIGLWGTFAATIGKTLTKFNGVVDANNNPVNPHPTPLPEGKIVTS
jgi:hypothetical protein